MPCTTRPLRPRETLAERMAKDKKRLQDLEAALAKGKTRVKIGPNGAVMFDGWAATDRDGITDVCAYRTLSSQGSFALRQAVQRAEAMSGRKVDARAVAAGWHSHDGSDWSKH